MSHDRRCSDLCTPHQITLSQSPVEITLDTIYTVNIYACTSYFIVLVGEMLQVGRCVAPDGVQPVVQHGDDLWQLWLTPASGAGTRTFPQSAVQRGHAAPLPLRQWGSGSPVVLVPWAAHVAIQRALVTPEEEGEYELRENRHPTMQAERESGKKFVLGPKIICNRNWEKAVTNIYYL